MGHGKNKQKQSGGFGKEPKETREQRRRRIAEEAKARESCMKMLPYVGGIILVLVLAFGIWVRTLPPKAAIAFDPADPAMGGKIGQKTGGLTFEEAVSAAEAKMGEGGGGGGGGGGEEPNPEDVVNLDGDGL
ncbi:hypothetical protein ACHAXT_004122 [Thalassiosira profunda]